MRVHTLPTTTHGRYVVRDGPQERLLLGFHGYAENAEQHLADLEKIPGIEAWTVVAVQALNRFYLKRTPETVASWMTSQDRELVIADNIDYVRAVVAALPRAGALVVAGFSQGGAMAYRAAAHLGDVAGAIVLAADLPRDVTGPLPPLLVGRGERDDWYTAEKLEKDLKFLEGRAAVRTLVFDGGHEWTDAFRSAAGEFLSSVLTGQYVDESVK
jgi:dienelactone hydrolase